MFTKKTGLTVTVKPSIVLSELGEITGAIGLLVGSFNSGVLISFVSAWVGGVIGEQLMSSGITASQVQVQVQVELYCHSTTCVDI